MEHLAKQALLQNIEEVQNLIKYYEELKDIPNINIVYTIARKFMVFDYCKSDEHQQHLGI